GEIPTPTLLKPAEDVKVRIREDDRQGVIRTAALQVSSNIDATFAVEKARSVGNFMGGHCRRTVVRANRNSGGPVSSEFPTSTYPPARGRGRQSSRRWRPARLRQWVGGNPAGGAGPPTPTASRRAQDREGRAPARPPPLSLPEK